MPALSTVSTFPPAFKLTPSPASSFKLEKIGLIDLGEMAEWSKAIDC